MIKANNAFPVFIVKKLNEAESFYSNYFGFAVAFKNEWYLHLVSESGIQIGFMLPEQPTQPEIFHQAHNGNGTIFSLEVGNTETAYSKAKKHSLDIVLELRSEDWGQYHFYLKDPNGIYLDVVEAIEASEEYQQGYENQ